MGKLAVKAIPRSDHRKIYYRLFLWRGKNFVDFFFLIDLFLFFLERLMCGLKTLGKFNIVKST